MKIKLSIIIFIILILSCNNEKNNTIENTGLKNPDRHKKYSTITDEISVLNNNLICKYDDGINVLKVVIPNSNPFSNQIASLDYSNKNKIQKNLNFKIKIKPDVYQIIKVNSIKFGIMFRTLGDTDSPIQIFNYNVDANSINEYYFESEKYWLFALCDFENGIIYSANKSKIINDIQIYDIYEYNSKNKSIIKLDESDSNNFNPILYDDSKFEYYISKNGNRIHKIK